MSFMERVRGWFDPVGPAVEARSAAPFTVSYEYPNLQTQLSTITGWRRAHGWGPPTVDEALAVPSILRCVTLISTSGGQLTMRGYRDGSPMEDNPRIISRPDPDRTPRGFYEPSTWNMATYGETVWYIANRDSDGLASALVVVPLRELTVEPNPNDRRRPRYIWGTGSDRIVSTRWTPNTTEGRFVHVFLNEEPGKLRGAGPLQRAGAAVSVSVESQNWARGFYADGGYPSINLHNDEPMSDDEAADARNQWASTPQNMPQVTSGSWEIREIGINPQGAQMLEARSHQDGEAARMFGMPGSLVEFNAPGSSLTYQNVGEVFTFFVKTCLQPYYLEPQEQAMSDLLPRSTVARFNVDAFYRPDMRSRWEVYDIATRVLGQEEAAQWAREREGLAPGDIEYKPVLFAPPAAAPTRIPSIRTAVAVELRCDGMVQKRNGGVAALAKCGKLLAKDGVFVGRCPRCKKEYAAA